MTFLTLNLTFNYPQHQIPKYVLTDDHDITCLTSWHCFPGCCPPALNPFPLSFVQPSSFHYQKDSKPPPSHVITEDLIDLPSPGPHDLQVIRWLTADVGSKTKDPHSGQSTVEMRPAAKDGPSHPTFHAGRLSPGTKNAASGRTHSGSRQTSLPTHPADWWDSRWGS